MSTLSPVDAYAAHIAIDLDDDHRLIVAMYPEDRVIWWVVERDTPANARHGCSCARCAPHEGRGRMPADWQRRIGRQCIVTKKNGHRCRNITPQPGQECRVHEGWSK